MNDNYILFTLPFVAILLVLGTDQIDGGPERREAHKQMVCSHKYKVVSDNMVGYTNSKETKGGCIETNSGTICGDFVIINNRGVTCTK